MFALVWIVLAVDAALGSGRPRSSTRGSWPCGLDDVDTRVDSSDIQSLIDMLFRR